MTGEGVALPREDADEIDRRFAGFQAAYRPMTEAGRKLVYRAAMLSVRLERCVVHEASAISAKVRAAESDFDEAREDRVDELFEAIGENPGPIVRKLLRMPEGVDRMLDTWSDLRADLSHGDGSRWTPEHGAMAIHLTGRKPGGFGIARVEALSRAVAGDFSLLDAGDGSNLDPKARREWARRAMASLIDSAIEKLEAHRATLDHEAIAADRAGAGARALFDPSKGATLARKYEAAAERQMHRAIREMKAIEAEASDRGDSSPIPASSLGSFSPPTAPRSYPAAPMPSDSRFDDAPPSILAPKGFDPDEPGRF